MLLSGNLVAAADSLPVPGISCWASSSSSGLLAAVLGCWRSSSVAVAVGENSTSLFLVSILSFNAGTRKSESQASVGVPMSPWERETPLVEVLERRQSEELEGEVEEIRLQYGI
ncbi:hypothetical protein NDU88_003646 [Pleurodeles waltl]|uniref:Secreted protein n=1 Tax=Pleurodeles waltl TaxID=8319 RepID=A0AAV7NHA2_PLEWA|nr:hypothetical protein NDU88_003646 [Pleurodeles waltl]